MEAGNIKQYSTIYSAQNEWTPRKSARKCQSQLAVAKVKHVMSAARLGPFLTHSKHVNPKTRLIGDTRMFELGA
jgi:hypothetical protein